MLRLKLNDLIENVSYIRSTITYITSITYIFTNVNNNNKK